MDRREMYSKETHELYMKYMMQHFGQLTINFKEQQTNEKEEGNKEAN